MTAAIKTENLGKLYQLGKNKSSGYQKFSDALVALAKASFMKRVSHEKDTFWALQNVGFTILPGEKVGIIGSNGAGKSTLLKILSRITEPSTGKVQLHGRVASLLEVGAGFHPELTGRENVFLNGALLGMKRAEIKKCFDEIVAFSGVEVFLDTPVKRYSSGMYVRLAFSVAAHLPAEIMIIDEVLAVGDAEFQAKCLDRINSFSSSGRTVLFVSHNLTAVRHLCSRGLLLKAGSIEFDGPIEDALERYTTQQCNSPDMRWTRAEAISPGLQFVKASAQLNGNRELFCDIELKASEQFPAAFFAIDICDPTGTPLMQSIPREDKFIHGGPGTYRVQLSLPLPALIPGRYLVDLWVGSHYTETLDYVKQKLAFEIVDAPQPGRVFPYNSAHGFLAPVSSCTMDYDQLQ